MRTILFIFVSLLGFCVHAEVETIQLPFNKKLEITLGDKTIVHPSSYLEKSFLIHAGEILKKIVRQEDPDKINLSFSEKELLPVVERLKKDVSISFGAMVALDYEDELAFLLVRALEGNPSFQDVEGCTSVMKRFILHTLYNPSAAVKYFEKMVLITERQDSYREKDAKEQNTFMRQQRELAKSLIKHYSWNEIELSQRIVNFKYFPDSYVDSFAKRSFYPSFYHRFFGPDYEKHFEEKIKPILILVVGLASILIPIWLVVETDIVIKYGATRLAAIAAQLVKSPTAANVMKWYAYFSGLVFAGWGGFKLFVGSPPENLKEEIEELRSWISFLGGDGAKNYPASEFVTWFNSIGYKRLLSDERKNWLGSYVQSAYEKWANAALSANIKFWRGHDLVSGSNISFHFDHLRLLTYPMLVKFSAIFGYKEVSPEDRVLLLREELARIQGFDSKNGTRKYHPENTFPFLVAIRVLAEFNEDIHSEAEFALALEILLHLEIHKSNKWGYWDLLPDLASDRCDLFFKFNAVASLDRIIREGDRKANIQQCLVREISRHSEYGKIIQQFASLKTNFPDDEQAINAASRKLHSILNQYRNLQQFVSELKRTSFNEDSPVFFEIASAIGESLAEQSHLISDIDDVHLALDTQSFWAYKKSDAKDINSEALDLLQSIWRSSNGYNIELTEKLHGILYSKWMSFNPNPSKEEALAIWEKMVQRGTSIHTDKLFWKVYKLSSDAEHREKLEKYALSGLLHNQEIKKKLVLNQIKNSQSFEKVKRLHPVRDKKARTEIINSVIESSRKALKTSVAHIEIMEAISTEVETTQEESRLVEDGKGNLAKVGKDARDDGFGLITEVINAMKEWSKERQWNLILFLVGHEESIDASSQKFLLKLSLTPLRLRDYFNTLPESYQYTAMDALLNQRNGLLETIHLKEEWTQKVVNHLLNLVHQDARQIVEEMLVTYLEVLHKPGLESFRSTVFAHLLVSSKKGSHHGNILAETCKHLGAFGIKIGQFLLASGILPEEESKALLDLEDNARSPTREMMYKDLREIFGDKPIPYTIKGNVGGASLKYVVRAETLDGRDVALKILSKEALIHTKMEEKLLKDMAAVLVKKYGQKYAIFKAAVHASAEAIKREIDFDAEVKRSHLAQEQMYKQCGKGVAFYPVKETLIHERLIEAEYAPGANIQRLEGDAKNRIAAAIVDCESKNFFTENPSNGVIYFDPDRHSGNYRVTDDAVYPIDFGQLHTLSVQERSRLIDLAAMAGIFSKVGENGLYALRAIMGPFVLSIYKLFGQSHEKRDELASALSETFSQYHSETGLTPYYRLISVLEDAGLLNLKDRILCYDLPKGIMQLARLGKLALRHDASVASVEEIYRSKVTVRAERLWSVYGKDPSYTDLAYAALQYHSTPKLQPNVETVEVAQPCEYFGTEFSPETCVYLENRYAQFIVQYFLLPLSFESISSMVGSISDALYEKGVTLNRFMPFEAMYLIDVVPSKARDTISELSRLPSSLYPKSFDFIDEKLRPAVVIEFLYLFLIQDVMLKRVPKWILRVVGLEKYEEYVDNPAAVFARVCASSYLIVASSFWRIAKDKQKMFLISFVYGMVMEVTGNVYYPIAMHWIHNVATHLRR